MPRCRAPRCSSLISPPGYGRASAWRSGRCGRYTQVRVISTIAFDSEDEGLAIANDTNYGLHAAVYTNDLDTAIRAARTLRAGTVSVNAYSEGDITTPFGGYKESGFGGRDKGLEAFDQYTEKKTVWISVKP